MMPLSTSPVPAVARRASPDVTIRTRPSGAGHDGGRPLEEHDGARRAPPGRGRRRGDPAPGRAPVSRSNSPSWGVSTVGSGPVTEHRRRIASEGGQRVAVDSSGQAGAGDHVADGRLRGRTGAEARDRSRAPGTGGPPRRTTSVQPAAGSAQPDGLHRATGVVGDTGRAEADHARAGPLGRGRREVGRARHARRPGHHEHGGLPLVARGSARRAATRARRRPRPRPPRARRRRGRCRPPPPRPASDRPGSSTRPGLSAAKVTVRMAGSTRPCASPGQAVDAARDVDGEHRRATRRRARCARRRKPVP